MRENINKPVYLLLTLFLLCLSCSKPSRLELALKAAGENRVELEKVLEHFKDDPLKLKAAIFLIENMPGHYSFVNRDLLYRFNNALDSLTLHYGEYSFREREILWREVYHRYAVYGIRGLATVPDVEIITAEFLIRNIEQAFEVWQDAKWARHLSFEDFCELILPYKVMQGQEFDNWREYSRTMFNHSLDIIRHSPPIVQNPILVCNIVSRNMRRAINPRLASEWRLPITRMSALLHAPTVPSCDDHAFMKVAVMRANGIPVAMDFTPQWASRSRGHSWNVVLQNTGKMGVFGGIGGRVGAPYKQDRVMAKVYRKTFAINREIERIHQVEQYVPLFISTPFIRDVTDEYMVTVNVTIPLQNRPNFQYAYLAVFNNVNWTPISWGRASRRSVTFNSMGRGVAYLPVRYTQSGIEAIGNPFILTIRGDVKELAPDTLQRQTLRLYRKFPLKPHAFIGVQRLIGAEIQAANRADFSDFVTIHRFDDVKKDIRIDYPSQKFRYWRFLSAPEGFVNLAEMLFWERDSQEPIRGEIIGTSGSHRDPRIHGKEAAFDGDFLTFFYAPIPTGAWVGMDFGKPVDIARIVCFMRSDGNYIEPGDEYELLYWRDGGWQSLGRKIATDIYLVYENSPTNALFLLRNHTKGVEERIFTYENDRQVFW